MGWFWQSPSTSPKPQGSSSTPATPPAGSQPPAPPSPQTTTPAETEDREVAVFLNMFLQDVKPDQDSSPTASSNNTSSASPTTSTSPPTPPPSSSSPSATTSTTTTSWFSWPSAKSRQPEPSQPQPQPQPQSQPAAARTRTPQSLAMSEHLLPTTMSCRDAFDYAWHCHTPGSQWNAVYRYGTVRTCSELWDDFWFCMRTRSYAPALRAEAIREHYRAKEEAKYGGGGRPSSEDVWESRDERVAPGTAFQAKFDPPIRDDAEFRRLDAERRRKIREMRGMEQEKE